MVGTVLTVLMVAGAFAVDLGLQRVARSDMQALADVVALDLAREIDGRTTAELQPVMEERAGESLGRNRTYVGEDEPTLDIDLGRVTPAGTFVAVPVGVPSAVRVEASTEVDFAFAAATGQESGGAARSAVAAVEETACYRLGSFVAAVRSGDSTVLDPLNDLFGVNLTLVGYQGLANATVTLAELAARPTIGSPEALLQGRIAYSTLVQAMIEVLQRRGGNQVALSALDTILKVAPSFGGVTLGNVLNVAPTDNAALDIGLDILDILGSARMSDGTHFINVPNIQAQVPGVGFQFTGDLALISAAELACGTPNSASGRADNSQLEGVIGIELVNLPSLNVPGIGTLQTARGLGSLDVHIGNAEGQLVAPPPVKCGAGTIQDPDEMTVRVTSVLSSYGLDLNVVVEGEVKLSVLDGLGLGNLVNGLLGGLLGGKTQIEIGVNLRVNTTAAPVVQDATVRIPPNDVTPVRSGTSVTLDPYAVVPRATSVTIGGKGTLLSAVTALTTPIINALTTGTNNFVGKTIVPLINNINDRFVGPVARMVGLRLGGADVYGVGATCGLPALRG